MDKKAAMELRFGKGPEHEEICDLFAEFAFQLDRRLPDGDHKTRMLSQLDFASQYAHEAVKDVYPPITGIKEHGENVAIKNEDLYDTEIPDAQVSLTDEVDKAVKKASEYAFEEDAASHPVTPAMKVYRAEKDAIRNYDSGGLKRKGVEFKSPIQDYPPVIDE